MSVPDVPKVNELARRLADAFEEAGVRYAIGGAIALVYAAAARTTNDVDVNLFDADVDRAFAVLERLGASFDEKEARRTISERGDFCARLEGYLLDIFVAFSDVHEEIARRRLKKPLLGRPAWVLSPEDLVDARRRSTWRTSAPPSSDGSEPATLDSGASRRSSANTRPPERAAAQEYGVMLT